jgi:RNA polymerase sigma factor (sigma-70 family)
MGRYTQNDVQLERTVVEDPGDKLALQDAMEKLRVSYRQAVTLRYIQDMTTEETAQILGWSQGKVRTTLHRALMALQKELSEPVYDIRQRRYET